MYRQPTLWIVRTIFVLGLVSVGASLLTTQSDWAATTDFTEFFTYFSGVPVAFLQYSGIVTAADPSEIIVGFGLVVAMLCLVCAVLSEKTIKRIPPQEAQWFLGTLVCLCVLNFYITYFSSVLRLPSVLAPISDAPVYNWDVLSRYIGAIVQTLPTLLFYLIWSRRTPQR